MAPCAKNSVVREYVPLLGEWTMKQRSGHVVTQPPSTPALLKAWRERLGFTQVQASILVGVSNFTWSRMETGTVQIERSLALLCWVLEEYPEVRQAVTHWQTLSLAKRGTK
jgi:hypothetical protein